MLKYLAISVIKASILQVIPRRYPLFPVCTYHFILNKIFTDLMLNRQDIHAEIKAMHKGDIQFRLVCEVDKRFGLVSWGYRSEPTVPEGISEEKIT